MIREFLAENYDLSDIEIKLYITLLKIGPSTIMDLANVSEINRATTHINVESLIKKGFITQSKKVNSKRRIVIAEEPSKLQTILKRKKTLIEKAELILPDIVLNLSKISDIKKEGQSDVDIQYFEGKSEVEHIYEQVFKCTELRSYVNLQKIKEFLPNNTENYIKAHQKNKKMKIWSIISTLGPDSNFFEEVLDKKRYFAKYIKAQDNTPPVDSLIFDGAIAYITVEEMPKGVLIKNKYMYQHAVQVYGLIWNLI